MALFGYSRAITYDNNASTPDGPARKEAVPIPAQPPVKRHPYDQWSPDARALDLVGDKWTMLIIRDLAGGPRRFVELQRTLPGISTEQLRSRLNRMVADDLLTRQRYREVPPRVDYELTERSRALLPVIGELARWGYQWAWGPPRPGEMIDIGAILRAATGLTMPGSVDGIFEIRIDHPERGVLVYTLTVSDGALGYAERGAPDADAHISGPDRAFVEVFLEHGARTELEVTGDAQLADRLIGVLRSGAPAASLA